MASIRADFDADGTVLATGDFDGDGRADLAIGAAHQAIGAAQSCGMVHVLRGGDSGLTGIDSPT